MLRRFCADSSSGKAVFRLTRHELKDQIQHDRFTDAVSGAVVYASAHRRNLIRWGIIAAVIAVIVGVALWYSSYQRSLRRQDLETALIVAQAPVGSSNQGGTTYPTQQAKQQASIKALSEVVAKHGGSSEGLIAQYYLGTIKAQMNNTAGAESDLKAVANSSSEFSPLAKIALSQVYAGENKMADAQALLQDLAKKGSDLVSKSQATILLAQLDRATDPKKAKDILQSLKSDRDPAVVQAVNQISEEQAR